MQPPGARRRRAATNGPGRRRAAGERSANSISAFPQRPGDLPSQPPRALPANLNRRQGKPRYARSLRDPCQRILKAAEQLFYQRGIHTTGIAALVEAAHVSTRTPYQQFGSKNALVEEYLRRFEADQALESERQLGREDVPPATRLLAIFDRWRRGCGRLP